MSADTKQTIKYETLFRNYPDVMNVKDVMAALGIGKRGVYNLINSGGLTSFQIGRAHKVPKCALIAYIKETTQDEN